MPSLACSTSHWANSRLRVQAIFSVAALLRTCVFLSHPYISAAQLRLGACANGSHTEQFPRACVCHIFSYGAPPNYFFTVPLPSPNRGKPPAILQMALRSPFLTSIVKKTCEWQQL